MNTRRKIPSCFYCDKPALPYSKFCSNRCGREWADLMAEGFYCFNCKTWHGDEFSHAAHKTTEWPRPLPQAAREGTAR